MSRTKKTSRSRTPSSKSSENIKAKNRLAFSKKAIIWLILTIIIPILIGIIAFLFELYTEKPNTVIFNTSSPDVATILFYQELAKHRLSYHNDSFFIRVENFKPYDDINPIFRLEDLPYIDMPITIRNTGRKATTVSRFILTMYSSPAMISKDGYLIDDLDNSIRSSGVFVDVGQEIVVKVRFYWDKLDGKLKKPKYNGPIFGTYLSDTIFKIEITDIEGRVESTLVRNTLAETANTSRKIMWWSTLVRGKANAYISYYPEFESPIEQNIFVVNANTQAGRAYLDHNEPQKALEYFNSALKGNSEYADGYYYRALTYKLLGNLGAAIDDLKRCIDIDNKSECVEEIEVLEHS